MRWHKLSSINDATLTNTLVTISDVQNSFMCDITIQVTNDDNSKFTITYQVAKPLVDYILSQNYTKQQIIDMLGRKNPDIVM